MAAQNPPSFVMAVVRDAGLWSLTNAFTNPVSPNSKGDLVYNSQRRFDDYWKQLTRVYGSRGIAGVWWVGLDSSAMPNLQASEVPCFDDLIEQTVGAALNTEHRELAS